LQKTAENAMANISGMADAIYFRSGMGSLLACWHLHNEFGIVRRSDHDKKFREF